MQSYSSNSSGLLLRKKSSQRAPSSQQFVDEKHNDGLSMKLFPLFPGYERVNWQKVVKSQSLHGVIVFTGGFQASAIRLQVWVTTASHFTSLT